MFPPVWKIEGPFAGVDPLIVMIAAAVTVGVIIMTAVVARQLARLQPKAPPPSQVQKASGEFDAWTERPKEQSQKDAEYYSLYGSQPGRGAMASLRAPPAPPPPVSPQALGNVMVDLSVGGPPADEGGWVAVPESAPSAFGPASGAPPAVHPPARPKAFGPTEEVVAPSHRRIRDTSTGDFPPRESVAPPFERSSVAPGAVAPRGALGDGIYSPRSLPPPPPPTAPPDPAQAALVAEALPEGTPIKAPAKTVFRGPSRGQTVVGAGQTGVQEGAELAAGKKAIRCPKCQTVFAGPAARPATVKCPACGTTGTLK